MQLILLQGNHIEHKSSGNNCLGYNNCECMLEWNFITLKIAILLPSVLKYVELHLIVSLLNKADIYVLVTVW